MAVDPVSPGEGQRLAKHNTNDIEAHSQSSESAEGRDIDDGKYVDSAAVSPDEAFAEDYEGGDGWETRSLPEPGSTLQTSTPEIKSPSASELAYDQWCERNIASLLEACCNRDPAKAIRILEQAYERQVAHKMTGLRDDFSETALHVASGHGEIEVVKQLLAKGADVNAVNNLGCTPLNRAVVAGSIKVRSTQSVIWIQNYLQTVFPRNQTNVAIPGTRECSGCPATEYFAYLCLGVDAARFLLCANGTAAYRARVLLEACTMRCLHTLGVHSRECDCPHQLQSLYAILLCCMLSLTLCVHHHVNRSGPKL